MKRIVTIVAGLSFLAFMLGTAGAESMKKYKVKKGDDGDIFNEKVVAKGGAADWEVGVLMDTAGNLHLVCNDEGPRECKERDTQNVRMDTVKQILFIKNGCYVCYAGTCYSC